MSWPGGWFDPELEDLFHEEPELLETARRVRAARPQTEPDPRFQNRLRAQLIAEATRSHGARRWWRLGSTHAAWGGAVLGVALIGATALTFLSNHPQDRTITAISAIAAEHAVDPNNVIQVSFNQPMDKAAVEKGVRIQPATEVSYSWTGNDLVITPVHHLTGNTPYTVTIAQSAIRAATGAVATTPIVIPFATAPTPPVGRSTPPTLALSIVGPQGTGVNGLGGMLLFAPDGSLVSTAGLLPAPPGTPPVAASPTPGTSPTPTPEGVPDNTPSVAGQLVDYASSGGPFALAAASSAAAFSPNGTYVAAAVDDGNGGSKIVVTLADGSQHRPTRLVDSSSPVIALTWASSDRIVYTDGATINEIDLSGKGSTLYTVPASGGSVAKLDPGGAYAFVAPASGTGGNLLDIATDAEVVLQGSTTAVGFSGDGSTVVWADQSTSRTRFWTESVTQQAPASMSLLDGSATYGDIALDADGDAAAYLMTPPSQGTQVVIAEVPSGAPIAIEPVSFTPSGLALSPGGDQIALLGSDSNGGLTVQRAAVPGATAAHAAAGIPAAANSTLHAFVEAQVAGDLGTMAGLSGPNANAAANTPQNLSRAYVISTYVQPHGAVSASVELVVDPTAGHASAEVAGETLTLVPQASGTTYIVSRIASTPLHDEASGPHVLQVNATTQSGQTTLAVSFDSDLNPASVGGAFTVLDSNGTTLTSSTVYDANSRTATVTIASTTSGALTLEISTALDDVYGQTLAHAFQTVVGTNS
ncbi:MAG TPA: Ig-like domain-containing protein [Candidatus Acidoferrales bacterium]|nr:Ig-like domain-containing protein [Candidatus Acidoferrales bacterium]